MIIEYDQKFVDHFIHRIQTDPKTFKRALKMIELFSQNPGSIKLKDHQLIGKLNNLRSFSITKDIRVIYQVSWPNQVIFIDIGTHQQVYS